MEQTSREQVNRVLNNSEIMTKPENDHNETKMGIYCIFDTLAQLHGPSFEAINDAVAVRQYERMDLPPQDREEFILKRIGQKIGDKIKIDYLVLNTTRTKTNNE